MSGEPAVCFRQIDASWEIREGLRNSRARATGINVDSSDGWTISVSLSWYPRLVNGTPAERSEWRLTGRGNGIHWPGLDEDISVAGLIAGKPSGERAESLERWLASRTRQV